MKVIQIYNSLNQIWLFLIILQMPIIYLSNKIDGVKPHIIKDFISSESADEIPKDQPFLTIMIINSVILLLYIFTRAKLFISIGIPIGGLFLYLSFAGDLSDYIFYKDDSDSSFLNSIELKNLIRISLLSVAINIIVSNEMVRELNNCHELYALLEIFVLIILLYSFLYYLGISIYLILGHISWDSKGNLQKKIKTLKKENKSLKINIGNYAHKLDQKAEKMSSPMRFATFIPSAILFTFAIIVNYFKQIKRNIQLLCLLMTKNWVDRRKVSLQRENLLYFSTIISHLSIIIVLCTAYIWLNFELGDESRITKIVYGFSTIILIPIAINKFSSTKR